MRSVGRSWCVAAGTCDVATGVLLVAAPAMTLRLMGVHESVAQPVFIRFIGTFAGAVGLLYYYALARQVGSRAAHLVEAATIVRLAVALFVGAAVVLSALSAPWLTVTATDLSFAVVQILLLRRGAFDDAR